MDPLLEGEAAGPYYEPPYAGALQDEVAWHAVKYLGESVRLESEVGIELPGAFFSLDYLLTSPGFGANGSRRVAIECAGAKSLRDARRLLRRDATLLASAKVDALYRLGGTDLLYSVTDALYLVSEWEGLAGSSENGYEPIFSGRGRANLRSLASPYARAIRLRKDQASVLVTYPLAEIDPSTSERFAFHRAHDIDPFLLVRRLDRSFPEAFLPYAQILGA